MDKDELQPPVSTPQAPCSMPNAPRPMLHASRSTPHAPSPTPHAYIIVGPTASGKSSVAQYLAEQTGSKIVSADSMNIYRGMNIGTAKPSKEERGAVDYYGIDLVDPTESFSVGDWLEKIKPAFNASERYPIVAGGTGLYVKCLLAGLESHKSADEELRARAETMSLADLQAEARSTLPDGYDALSDKDNPRRLIRLIEQGKVPSRWDKKMPKIIGLHVDRAELHSRIAKRVDLMYSAGLVDEARELVDNDLSSTASKAIGYAEAFAFLRGEMSEDQAKERTVIRTRQLAKRQMTWFRHQLNVEWVNVCDFSNVEKLADRVKKVWGKVPVTI